MEQNHPLWIDSYQFGAIVINGIQYKNDVIIFPDRVEANWWRESGHSLILDDLKEVIEAKPDILIIGKGANGRMQIPETTAKQLDDLGIRLISLLTEAACEEYNRMSGDPKVIAALHLTC